VAAENNKCIMCKSENYNILLGVHVKNNIVMNRNRRIGKVNRIQYYNII